MTIVIYSAYEIDAIVTIVAWNGNDGGIKIIYIHPVNDFDIYGIGRFNIFIRNKFYIFYKKCLQS